MTRNIIVVDESDHGGSLVLDAIKHSGVADVVDGPKFEAMARTEDFADDKLVITSENALNLILEHLAESPRRDAIATLKDKARCREMLKDVYPDFFFERVATADLASVELPPEGQFVVKPNKGYFATAIKYVDASTDLSVVRDEIQSEVAQRANHFEETVISADEVVIEGFISGEEYAVDMFYNADGEPVIINIYHHPIPDNPDYLHALYYTSKSVFDEMHDRFVDWFAALNRQLKASSFPIHAEFRLDGETLMPIELNPLRYGGDGLVDICYHAFGFNPFAIFFADSAPDWSDIWDGRDDKFFVWMLGYVGTDIDVASHRPDMGRFQGMFNKVLSDSVLNYQSSPGFSVVYAEEESLEDIYRLVNVDFRKFFMGDEAFSEQALIQLYRSGVRVTYPPEAKIWDEGDHGDYALLIVSGTVEVLQPSEDGEVVLDTIGAESAVGEFSVMDGRPRSAGARAGTEGCTAMRVSGASFRGLLRQSADLFEELYWQQQTRLRKMNKRIGELESRLRELEG